MWFFKSDKERAIAILQIKEVLRDPLLPRTLDMLILFSPAMYI